MPWHDWTWWQQSIVAVSPVLGFAWAWFGYSKRFAYLDASKEQ